MLVWSKLLQLRTVLSLSLLIPTPQASLVDKRVHNIVETLTYIVYMYVSRGLFEKHKSLYSLLLACEINMEAGAISHLDFSTLLKGGATLNMLDVRKKPFTWISDEAWLNAVSLSYHGTVSQFSPLFRLAFTHSPFLSFSCHIPSSLGLYHGQ